MKLTLKVKVKLVKDFFAAEGRLEMWWGTSGRRTTKAVVSCRGPTTFLRRYERRGWEVLREYDDEDANYSVRQCEYLYKGESYDGEGDS